ncbi:MAG: FAD-dependent monooxygenase [Phycisphaeraceae bacterium]
MKQTASPTQREPWDALVIGAGPAGSIAAFLLARQGHRVLLVDRSRFPRTKVCGGCINPAAVEVLKQIGLGDMLHRLHARPTRAFLLTTGRTTSTHALTGGMAISREAFDQALVDEAVAAGAEFRDGCSATLDAWDGASDSPPSQEGVRGGSDEHPLLTSDESEAGLTPSARPSPGPSLRGRGERVVHLHRDGQTVPVHAKVILACTGLDARLLEGEPGLTLRIARRSHMGVSAIAQDAPPAYDAGIIHMIHGKGGYVGLVRIENGALDIAAALSPAFVKKLGGPAAAVAAILKRANQPAIPLIDTLDWHGTPLLTRRRDRVASHRLFVLGDAAGYVEPFTGEGIAWALASAQASAPIVHASIDAWQPAHAELWNKTHQRLLGSRQRRCRWLTRALRLGPMVGLANRLLRWVPGLAGPVVRSIQATWQPATTLDHSLPQGESR